MTYYVSILTLSKQKRRNVVPFSSALKLCLCTQLAREQAEKEASRGTQSEMATNPNASAVLTPSALDQPSASASVVNDVSLTTSRVASSPVAVAPVIPVGSVPPNVGAESFSTAAGERVGAIPLIPAAGGASMVSPM